MAYNIDNYRRLRAEFANAKRAKEDAADRRTKELHQKLPDIAKIDRALALTGYSVMRETALGKEGLAERLDRIKRENLQLQADRAACLEYNGYPRDYTDVKYDCDICSDSGFVGGSMCSCFKRALIYAGYESSGIGRLISEQSFETFKLDYYKTDAKSYANAAAILEKCREYAKGEAVKQGENLLMCGYTGLGKTHLSTSIAKELIENGFDVVYDTAQNIFGDFEDERFKGFSASDDGAKKTDKYFDCDLLIIDDLGTEVSNQFTVACLYNIINTRLNHRKSVVINTNLISDELRKRYSDRITSRFLGEFAILMLTGRDIREQKLQNK